MSNQTRGQDLQQRRVRLGISSVNKAVELSKRLGMSISRDAITAAERDDASPATYQRLDALYDAWEHEISGPYDEPESESDRLVTFEIEGVYGAARVTVKGPIENLAELESAVERLLRQRPQ